MWKWIEKHIFALAKFYHVMVNLFVNYICELCENDVYYCLFLQYVFQIFGVISVHLNFLVSYPKILINFVLSHLIYYYKSPVWKWYILPLSTIK